MRFSRVLVACTLLLAPLHGAAQETEPPPDAGEAAVAAEAEPVAASVSPAESFAEDGTCPGEMTPQLAAGFGEPSGRLDATQSVHTPAGLSVLGNPVSYVIVGRASGGSGDVLRLAYRLQGVNNAWGTDYSMGLRRAFDEAFDVEVCGEEGITCMFEYTNAQARRLAGAELNNRMPSIPQGATGDAMPLLEADYDLEGADPVFLICNYRER